MITVIEFNQILGQLNDSTAAGPTELDLSLKKFTPEQFDGLCEALSKNKRLRKLTLSNCGIEAAQAISLGKALKTNQCLEHLSLDSNNIDSGGATGIGEALKNNRCLQHLSLFSNCIGDAGATGLGEGLRTNQQLLYLDLRYNDIGDEGAQAFNKTLDQNRSLVKVILQCIPQIGTEIDQKLARNTPEAKMQERLLFCMGLLDTSPKNKSSLQSLAKGELFDQNAVKDIFSFLGLASLNQSTTNDTNNDGEETKTISESQTHANSKRGKLSLVQSNSVSLPSDNAKPSAMSLDLEDYASTKLSPTPVSQQPDSNSQIEITITDNSSSSMKPNK